MNKYFRVINVFILLISMYPGNSRFCIAYENDECELCFEFRRNLSKTVLCGIEANKQALSDCSELNKYTNLLPN